MINFNTKLMTNFQPRMYRKLWNTLRKIVLCELSKTVSLLFVAYTAECGRFSDPPVDGGSVKQEHLGVRGQ